MFYICRNYTQPLPSPPRQLRGGNNWGAKRRWGEAGAGVGSVSSFTAPVIPSSFSQSQSSCSASLRLRQLRREDQGVEAELVDDCHLLRSTKGALNQGVLFVLLVHMGSKGISAFCIPQCRRHVPSHEERCAVVARPRSQNVLQKTHILINELTISPKSFLTNSFLDI